MPLNRLISKQTGFAIAGVLALTACAQFGVTVTRVDHAYQYDPFQVSTAGGGDRQLKVEVLGNPFEVSQDELERTVISSMQGRTFGVPVNFSAAPTNQDPNRNFHVVVAFNPEGVRDPGQLCTASSDLKSVATTGGTLTLMGALCSSDIYLSHAIARAGGIDGVNSDTLDSLVAQLTISLFPDENPNRQTDGEVPTN